MGVRKKEKENREGRRNKRGTPELQIFKWLQKKKKRNYLLSVSEVNIGRNYILRFEQR